ncbi:MAG: PQQ-binding-like beta-propeller repeat protein [Phycisphaerales bacterium]|jgi:outer membrane protein assembly factor BamB|nr:PQQ-binding-like beta-propeller repeat protein [Phycisphaerales bacterium]
MSNTLGVVPIFVNVGAAVFPAVIAAIGSVLGVMFRPRELVGLCIRRPLAALGVLAGGVGVVAMIVLFPESAPAPSRVSADHIDWNQVALRVIEHNKQVARGDSGGPIKVATSGAFIFRQGPARCGYDGGPAPKKLDARWSHRPPDAMCLSSPAVVDGRVFSATVTLDPIASYGSVFCLDAAAGKKRWSTDGYIDPDSGQEEVFRGFFSSPAITADRKYLVIGQGLHDDADCSLICLRTDTGKLHWRVKTPLHIEGSPAIQGDIAVAGAGAIEGPDGRAIGDTGFVFAVRISDGKQLWRHPVKDPESSPVIAGDGICYIGSGVNGCELLALRTAPEAELKAAGLKRELWRAKTPYPATGAVTLVGDIVVIGCGRGNYVQADPNPIGAVIAFDRKSGKEIWRSPLPDAVLGAVAGDGEKLICPVRNGQVVALNHADGEVLWRSRVNDKSPILAGPSLAGDMIYAVSRDGYLAVMNAADGTVIEKHYVDDRSNPGEMGLSVSSPIVAGGWIYVGSETGGLRSFSAPAAPAGGGQ